MRGARPERWIRQTNFDNDEAVGYLGDRLARLGVEEELAQAGAVPGCAGDDRRRDVRLGAVDAGRGGGDACRPRHGPAAGADREPRSAAAERKAGSPRCGEDDGPVTDEDDRSPTAQDEPGRDGRPDE